MANLRAVSANTNQRSVSTNTNQRTVVENTNQRAISTISDQDEDLRHTLFVEKGQPEFPYQFPIIFPDEYFYITVQEI